jgi:prepilin-type N-terminal cleavage/methylation domain-containing protein
MPRARGFTLIELTVVIIIIAVMSVGIVPAYQRLLGHVAFDSMAGDIESLFSEARTRAVTDGTEVDVIFNQQAETFVLVEQPPMSTADKPVALQTNTPVSSQFSSQSSGSSQAPITARVVHLGQNYAVPMFTPGSGTGGATSSSSANTVPNTVRFRYDGTCDGAQLTLLGSAGYSAQYVLLPATGRMQRVDPAGQQVSL